MGYDEEINRLIARIYDCAMAPDEWQTVVAKIAALIRADSGMLFFMAPQHNLWVVSTVFDPCR